MGYTSLAYLSYLPQYIYLWGNMVVAACLSLFSTPGLYVGHDVFKYLSLFSIMLLLILVVCGDFIRFLTAD